MRGCLGLCHSVACGSDPEAGSTVLGEWAWLCFCSDSNSVSRAVDLERFNLGPLISKLEVMNRVWGRGLVPQDV